MWQNMVPRCRTIRMFEGKGTQRSSYQNERIPARVRTNLQTNAQASATHRILIHRSTPISTAELIFSTFIFNSFRTRADSQSVTVLEDIELIIVKKIEMCSVFHVRLRNPLIYCFHSIQRIDRNSPLFLFIS